MSSADFLIIGAGIAGVSAAYGLAAFSPVVVLEQETQPGFHTTGRSAALCSEIYGNQIIRGLSRSSRTLLFQSLGSFAGAPFVRSRGAMSIVSSAQQDAFYEFRSKPDIASNTQELTTSKALKLVPILRAERRALVIFEPNAMHLEALDIAEQGVSALAISPARLRAPVAGAPERSGGRPLEKRNRSMPLP
jgi:D-arginine dehydrogenase